MMLAPLARADKAYRPAAARGLMPDPEYLVSDWAERHRILAEGTSPEPGQWRNDLVPFLTEIMDCLSPSDPCSRVTFQKSGQVGGSEGVMNFAAYIVDVAPGPTLIVHPTLDAAMNWDKEKLTPNIDANPRLKGKIQDKLGRQGGSTAKHKKFPGGFIALGGANSAPSLRQRSIKYLIKDDWDEWPFDVNSQGDPDKMAEARCKSYLKRGVKKFEISTPINKSVSRIYHSYQESDQRVFKVKCPHCGDAQELRFFPLSASPFRGGLKFNKAAPHCAHYVCEFNGCIIEEHEKAELLASGKWEAQSPGPGRHPGFKINALYSPFEPWDEIASQFVKAENKPLELKTFINLTLGEPWEEKGDAPDWKRLLSLRENYQPGSIPAGALLITAAVDVQKDGLYYEVVGWGIGKTSWVIDFGFLPGDTDRPETWKHLDELLGRRYVNAWGQTFTVDMMAIDANYNTPKVHAFARKKQNVMAVRGKGDRFHPILGTPTKQEISFNGKTLKGGLRVWPVGDHQAKLEIIGMLRLEGAKEGQDKDPWGYCHTHTACDENYFKQLTSESLATVSRNGKPVQEWIQTGENHFLDCRKYNLAAAERLGISRFTVADWQNLAAMRNVPRETLQGDLLDLTTRMKMTPAPAAAAPQAPQGSADAQDEGAEASPPMPPPAPAAPAPVVTTPPPAPPPRPARKRITARIRF